MGSELFLQLLDVEAQRRLGDEQASRGATEMQFLGDRDEVAKLSEIHGRHLVLRSVFLIVDDFFCIGCLSNHSPSLGARQAGAAP
ncbi:hypothetical protein K3Z99_12395 [Pseudomonas aeruginosa]|nr:hypothetical protein [Pseudomonas aeruginosa]